MHAHHALHLVVALRGSVRLSYPAGFVEAPAVLTGPDVPHELDTDGAEAIVVFVDPESDLGAGIAGSVTGVRAFGEDEREDWTRTLPADSGAEERRRWAGRVLSALAQHAPGEPGRRRVHPRVRKVLVYLGSVPPGSDTSIRGLAAVAGLSESRLTHAFRESVGIPLRGYLLWLKLRRAGIALSEGVPLARAAVEAGFSDAAHMSRTFRRMFGMNASTVRVALRRSPKVG